jgi:hypothetical protein
LTKSLTSRATLASVLGGKFSEFPEPADAKAAVEDPMRLPVREVVGRREPVERPGRVGFDGDCMVVEVVLR